ncbi:AlpA family transcriptional regulator [uncultured Roseobacter sp.]|uniref:helix-turn-helix transcriptional regulator n=1 Tax=uncultured Roseobacter sp. TaxID=114847 RepID=UPI00262F7518|nr:AlpA family phage regulatory protein [uncultured Roseobacter sp.]
MTYLNMNQLSEKLGSRSRSSIYRDVEGKVIPEPIRIGGRLYWVESAVDDAIAAAQTQAA